MELFDLQVPDSGGGVSSWEETARWIKYEEDVEGVDHHWGRPHVAFLTFHSLVQLRHCFSKGWFCIKFKNYFFITVFKTTFSSGLLLLDVETSSYSSICEKIAESMKKRFRIDDDSTNAVLNALSKTHKFVNNFFQWALKGFSEISFHDRFRHVPDTHLFFKSFTHSSSFAESSSPPNKM